MNCSADEAPDELVALQHELAHLKSRMDRAQGLLCGLEKGIEALILSHPQLDVLLVAFAAAVRPPADDSEHGVVDSQAIYTSLERLQAAVMRARLWQEERKA